MPDNPNTLQEWNRRWKQTGYKCPEQMPVNERKKAVAAMIPPNTLVLDVACGASQITEYMYPSVRYVGCDFSREALRLHSGCTVLADVRALPFRAHSIPIVIAMEILEHLENPRSFLVNLYVIAQTTIIISVPNNRLSSSHIPWHLTTYTRHTLNALIASVFPPSCTDITTTHQNLIARITL